MNKKQCTRCQEIKPRDSFYRHANTKDKLSSHCKKCHIKYSQATQKEKRKSNPQIHRAHLKTQRALASGKIRHARCCFCGSGKTEAHHPDYDKPLDVVWLCRLHHRAVHNAKA